MTKPIMPKTVAWKAVALAAGLGLGVLSYPVRAAPASGATVRGLFDVPLGTMRSGKAAV